MKKILCVLMALLMLVTAFSGCKKDDNNTPATTPTESGVKLKYADLGENIIALAGDYEITRDDINVYIDLIVPYIQQSVGSAEGWENTTLSSGLTARDELINAAIEECAYQMAFVDYAKNEGFYTDEAADGYYNEYITNFGGEEVLKEFLLEYGFNEGSFKKYISYMGAYMAATDKFCSNADAEKIFNDEFITAKHILVLFDGRDSEEAALAEANTIYKRAAAGENFEKLIEEFNEDPGQNAETGYTFGEGEMVDEFYNGALALNEGEISEPVKTTYGYHIIKRYANPEQGSEIYEQYIEQIKNNNSNSQISALYDSIVADYQLTVNEGILSSIDLTKYTVISDENVNYADGSVFDE